MYLKSGLQKMSGLSKQPGWPSYRVTLGAVIP